MKKLSKTHRLMRVGFREIKRRYGADEAREQAAEIWKLTSEEREQLAQGEVKVLSTDFIDKLTALYTSWKDKFTPVEWEFIRKVIAEGELLCTIAKSDTDADDYLNAVEVVRLRIRKLTERECFRLQDVDDKDIDKIMAINEDGKRILSASACYKLAGNSITIKPMELMFENLLFPKEQQTKPIIPVQLSLF